MLQVFISGQRYDSQIFGKRPTYVESMFESIILTGDKYTPTQSVYFITENQIESEEFLFDLGFEEKEYTFYKPRKESTLEIVAN